MDLSSCLSVQEHFDVEHCVLNKNQTEPQLILTHQVDTHDTVSKNSDKKDHIISVKKIKIKNCHQKT